MEELQEQKKLLIILQEEINKMKSKVNGLN